MVVPLRQNDMLPSVELPRAEAMSGHGTAWLERYEWKIEIRTADL